MKIINYFSFDGRVFGAVVVVCEVAGWDDFAFLDHAGFCDIAPDNVAGSYILHGDAAHGSGVGPYSVVDVEEAGCFAVGDAIMMTRGSGFDSKTYRVERRILFLEGRFD